MNATPFRVALMCPRVTAIMQGKSLCTFPKIGQLVRMCKEVDQYSKKATYREDRLVHS